MHLFYEYDITSVFLFIWGRLEWIVAWTKVNYIRLGTHEISFFELACGTAVTWLVMSFIPIFNGEGDTEDE